MLNELFDFVYDQISDHSGSIFVTLCLSTIISSLLYAHFYAKYETLFSLVLNWETKFQIYILRTYVNSLVAFFITSLTASFSSYFPSLLNFLLYHIRSYVIISFVTLELLIKKTNNLSYETQRNEKLFYFVLSSMIPGPFICFFGPELAYRAGYYTIIFVISITIFAYTCSEALHQIVLKNFAVVVLSIFIPISLATALLLSFGYPKNILGLTLILISLEGGFLVYSAMYILSSHLFVFNVLREPFDPIFGAIDIYLCVTNLYYRMLFYLSFTVTVNLGKVLQQKL